MAADAVKIINIWSSDEEQSPLKSAFSAMEKPKEGKKVKEETSSYEDADCFILDFDPFDSIDLSKKLTIDSDDETQEISVIAERGPVACRDFPHSRHLCVKFPFNQSPHESFCQMCYCYVCDTLAPCKYWRGITQHCEASDDESKWKLKRQDWASITRSKS